LHALIVLSVAKSLRLRMIAKGVENETQMRFLRTHQCDEIQGYYFSKPLTVDNIADQLRATIRLRRLWHKRAASKRDKRQLRGEFYNGNRICTFGVR
jgi:predicted signal transduction protein with EAL and GGDEF domain